MLDVPRSASEGLEHPTEPAPDFESFYLTHRVRLFRAMVVVTRDVHAAEELTQEAFVRIWERWDSMRSIQDRTGYLYRTALNGWFQVRRRAMRAARRTVAPRSVIDPLEVIEERDWLARRLLELPERQRAALVLTEYLSESSAEAARAMGIRPGTVRRLASKARAVIRRDEEDELT